VEVNLDLFFWERVWRVDDVKGVNSVASSLLLFEDRGCFGVVVVRVVSVEEAAQSDNEEDIVTPFFFLLLDVFSRCFGITTASSLSSLFFVDDDDDGVGEGGDTFCVSFPFFRP